MLNSKLNSLSVMYIQIIKSDSWVPYGLWINLIRENNNEDSIRSLMFYFDWTPWKDWSFQGPVVFVSKRSSIWNRSRKKRLWNIELIGLISKTYAGNSFAKCKNEKFDCPKGYLAQFLLINLHINTIGELEH